MLIYIIDPQTLFVEGLKSLLGRSNGATVRCCATAPGLWSLLEASAPDLLITEFEFEHGNCISLLRSLRSRAVTVPALVVSAVRQPAAVHRALVAGATGYVYKSADLESLNLAIEAVMGGSVYLPERIGRLQDGSNVGRVAEVRLARREAEVLCGVLKGWTNGQIGNELHLCASSVKANIRRLFKKLCVNDRVSLAVQAVRTGLDQIVEADLRDD